MRILYLAVVTALGACQAVSHPESRDESPSPGVPALTQRVSESKSAQPAAQDSVWRETTEGAAASQDLAPLSIAQPPAPTVPQEGSSRSEEFGPHQGQWEVTLSGVGGNDQDFETGSFSATGSLGYFLTQGLEVGVRQNVGFADPGVGSDVWNGSTRVALDLHLPIGFVVPFLGGNVGWVYGDSVNETMAAAPEAGVKVFLQSDAFLVAMAEFQFFFDSTDMIGPGFEDGQFVYSLGFGLNF